MDQNQKEIMMQKIERTMRNLEKNNMSASFVESRADVKSKLRELISEGDTVSTGGSVTLDECGVLAFLREYPCNLLDRYQKGLTREQIEDIFRSSFSADVYLASANAVTEKGELYNVDGNSNRIAAITYGPKRVILICGYNKIVSDLDAAVLRVKQTAAPTNSKRLSCDTYCRYEGRCQSFVKGDDGITSGCHGDGRICCNYLISAKQRVKGRIHVIFVGESLGY